MEFNALFRMITVSFLLILIPFSQGIASSLPVYFAGFAFSSDNANIATAFPITSKILAERDERGIPILETALAGHLKAINNPSISIISNQLGNYKSGDAVSVAFAIDWENVAIEKLDGTTKVVVDIQAEILVFDFSEMKIIGSFPVGVQIRDVQPGDVSPDRIMSLMREIYFGNGPSNIFDRFVDRMNNVSIKPSYGNRIRIASIKDEDNARATLSSFKISEDSFYSFTALSFNKFLSTNQSIAVLPYSKGQAIGGKMSARFANGDVYQLTIPDPDYTVHITVRGFKKVKIDETATERAWGYGSFIHLKIDQPELAKTYLDGDFKFAAVKKVPTGNVETDDWAGFQESLLSLLDQSTKQISKQDKDWATKWGNGDHTIDQFGAVAKMLERCR